MCFLTKFGGTCNPTMYCQKSLALMRRILDLADLLVQVNIVYSDIVHVKYEATKHNIIHNS